ncbi:MAG: YdcF family protein [Clostridia bacterium]|nr:YdcF family protein [Clostridia bacterium]
MRKFFQTSFKIVGILAALCALIWAVCNAVVCLSVRKKIVTREEAAGLDFDCVLVLGCGVMADGTPSAMLSDRLDEGIALYELGAGKKLLMSGDHGREGYDEVTPMKIRAQQAGVPDEDIFKDHAGFSTYDSMYRAKEVFQVEKMVIVTQGYHLYRALYIADQLGIEAVGVGADPRAYRGAWYFTLRETAARVKDLGQCLFDVPPVVLGDAIPISGDGRLTED